MTTDIFSLIPIMQKPRRVYEGKGFQRYFGEGYSAISLVLSRALLKGLINNMVFLWSWGGQPTLR